MSTVGQAVRTPQTRVLALFCGELGYRPLGDRTARAANANSQAPLLTAYRFNNIFSYHL